MGLEPYQYLYFGIGFKVEFLFSPNSSPNRIMAIITVIIVEIDCMSQSPIEDFALRLALPFVPPGVKANFAIE